MGAGLIKTFLGPPLVTQKKQTCVFILGLELWEKERGKKMDAVVLSTSVFFGFFLEWKWVTGRLKVACKWLARSWWVSWGFPNESPQWVSESAASQELESVQFTPVMLLSGLKNIFLMQTSSHKSAQRGNFQIEIYIQRATKLKFKLQPITAVYSFLHRCWQKSGGRLSFLLVEPRCFWAASCALAFFPFFINKFLCRQFELLKWCSAKWHATNAHI